MAEELVTLQLYRGRRRVGGPVNAWLDWRDRPELRRYLTDALKRNDIRPARIGEYRLEVRDKDGRKHLADFVATHDERKR